MKNCDYYQEILSRVLDGEANADEEKEAKEHIKTCTNCTSFNKKINSLHKLMRREREIREEESSNISVPSFDSIITSKNPIYIPKIISVAAVFALVLTGILIFRTVNTNTTYDLAEGEGIKYTTNTTQSEEYILADAFETYFEFVSEPSTYESTDYYTEISSYFYSENASEDALSAVSNSVFDISDSYEDYYSWI